MPISILILTKNEEQDLPGCLESVAWSDDIHVFDSLSTDGTEAAARRQRAQFYQRAFDGYASQRNASLNVPGFKYPWVFILDADERCLPALAEEMRAFVALAPSSVVAGRIARRDYFLGAWLRRSQITQTYLRLVRLGRVRYEREVNEVLIPDGDVGELKQHFDHFPFSKGVSHWLDKHNRYSSMEAKRAIEELGMGRAFSWRTAFFAKDPQVRRYHQKGLFYRMPGRTLIKFLYMFIWRRAFLDGRAGLYYTLLQSFYELMIVIKQREFSTPVFGKDKSGPGA